MPLQRRVCAARARVEVRRQTGGGVRGAGDNRGWRPGRRDGRHDGAHSANTQHYHIEMWTILGDCSIYEEYYNIFMAVTYSTK